jgi:two-component system, sensor histidine kinase
VPHTGKVSPEQRKGLGLGLAIVKRLAELMQAPLKVRSEPGRGTVFTLTLPAGKTARPVGRPSWGQVAATPTTLQGRWVVVVEDEPAVRAGLEVLLKSWGAEVASFDSVATCAQWARAAPLDLKPDLLIVDYRLEEGRTGLDALQVLRERFGAQTPAILVTGSTMTGHETEALQHNFHLLIKPVVPNKLRAMISFKLGVRTG